MASLQRSTEGLKPSRLTACAASAKTNPASVPGLGSASSGQQPPPQKAGVSAVTQKVWRQQAFLPPHSRPLPTPLSLQFTLPNSSLE